MTTTKEKPVINTSLNRQAATPLTNAYNKVGNDGGYIAKAANDILKQYPRDVVIDKANTNDIIDRVLKATGAAADDSRKSELRSAITMRGVMAELASVWEHKTHKFGVRDMKASFAPLKALAKEYDYPDTTKGRKEWASDAMAIVLEARDKPATIKTNKQKAVAHIKALRDMDAGFKGLDALQNYLRKWCSDNSVKIS